MEIYPGTRVSTIDLTREHIIYYVIDNTEDDDYSSTVRNLRLVDKNWCLTTTKLLRQYGQPLFNLSFFKAQTVNEEPDDENYKKSLKKFINCMTNPSRLGPNLLPYKVSFMESCFSDQEMCESLRSFLANCGNGIVALEIRIPETGLLNMIFPDTTDPPSFPLLAEFFMNIDTTEMTNFVSQSLNCRDNITNLLESVFNGAKDLEYFYLSGYNWQLLDFRLPILPPNLQCIEFSCMPTISQLNVIVKSNLHQLKEAILPFPGFPYGTELYFRILQNRKDTLKILQLFDAFEDSFSPARAQKHMLQFPVLTALEDLTFFSINCQLQAEKENCSVLNCFPNLHSLALSEYTDEMMETLCKNSTQHLSLTSLSIKPAQANGSNMDYKEIQRFRQIYPNIQNLNLSAVYISPAALQYVFMEMGQLKELKISISMPFRGPAFADVLETLLLGASPQEIGSLRENPELNNQIIDDDKPSIKMLKELATLTFSNDFNVKEDTPYYICSDLLFTLGFLKMPNLMNLVFKGGFNASEMMTETWWNLGRNIDYSLDTSE